MAEPDLVVTVVADLPDEVYIESSDKLSSRISSSTNCRQERESEIVETICELCTSHLEVELSTHKMNLLQQQEEHWAAEKFFRQQDESHKAMEHLFRQQEEARKAAKHIFRQQEEAKLQSISSSNRKKQSCRASLQATGRSLQGTRTYLQ